MSAERGTHLEAEKADGADHKVFSGCAGRRQHGRHVIDPQREEEKEAQQMTPDVYRLVGQNKQAIKKTHTQFRCVVAQWLGLGEVLSAGLSASRRLAVPLLLL